MAILTSITVNDTGFIKLPVGISSERLGSPSNGYMRFNSELGSSEVYDGANWIDPVTGRASIVSDGLVLHLDAGNTRSYSKNLFKSYGTGSVTEGVTFDLQGTTGFQRVASGTVIGGYTVQNTDVVYSYALGSTGCHYHGNNIPIPNGVYATFSFDYLVTGASNYPTVNLLANFENALTGSIGVANNTQDVWQRRSFTAGPTSSAGTLLPLLYPGGCSSSYLASSGTIYYKNPKVEFTNTDTPLFTHTPSLNTWKDLVADNNATLLNGVSYSTSNGGTLVFDGTDDYASGIIYGFNPNSGCTLETFVKRPSTPPAWRTYFNIKPNSESNTPFFELRTSGAVLNVRANYFNGTDYYTSAYTINSTDFYHMVATYNGSGSISLYINGSLYNTVTSVPSFAIGDNPTITIGRSYGNDRPTNIEVGTCTVYNRALTTSEISYNYNALKGRFGL